jgi:hypothetical protein
LLFNTKDYDHKLLANWFRADLSIAHQSRQSEEIVKVIDRAFEWTGAMFPKRIPAGSKINQLLADFVVTRYQLVIALSKEGSHDAAVDNLERTFDDMKKILHQPPNIFYRMLISLALACAATGDQSFADYIFDKVAHMIEGGGRWELDQLIPMACMLNMADVFIPEYWKEHFSEIIVKLISEPTLNQEIMLPFFAKALVELKDHESFKILLAHAGFSQNLACKVCTPLGVLYPDHVTDLAEGLLCGYKCTQH